VMADRPPNSMLQAVLDYATRRWPAIPVHSIRNGKCTCGKDQCREVGKHPRCRHGFKDATTDPAKLRAWWRQWPDANIGIATGSVSGLAVLDVDPRNGGHLSLEALRDMHGPMPHTVEAKTGGGGDHIVFEHPGIHLKCRIGLLPGIDFKGDGGYFIVEPSLHVSRHRYAWELSHLPGEAPLAPMPAWLLDLVREPVAPNTDPTQATEEQTDREDRENRDHRDDGETERASHHDSVSLYTSVVSVLSVSPDAPELAKSVTNAIELTVPKATGQRNNALFLFARCLKGIPGLAGLDIRGYRPIVKIWHDTAYPVIGTKPFEDSWGDFLHGFPQVQFPMGQEPLAMIVAAADVAQPPARTPIPAIVSVPG
jgi:hypothetical protein